jgi:hypothetical protein
VILGFIFVTKKKAKGNHLRGDGRQSTQETKTKTPTFYMNATNATLLPQDGAGPYLIGSMIQFSDVTYMKGTFAVLLGVFVLVAAAMANAVVQKKIEADSPYSRGLGTFGLMAVAHAFAMLGILKANGGYVDQGWVLTFFAAYTLLNVALNHNLRKQLDVGVVFASDEGDGCCNAFATCIQYLMLLATAGFIVASFLLYSFDKDTELSVTFAGMALCTSIPISFPTPNSPDCSTMETALQFIAFVLMALRLIAIVMFYATYELSYFPVYFFWTELVYLSLLFVFWTVAVWNEFDSEDLAVTDTEAVHNDQGAGPESVHLMTKSSGRV